VELEDLDVVEGPAFVGANCRIARDASVGPYSILGPSVTLRDRARTARSVIEASTHLGRSALVEGAIVGRSCDIRAHVRIHEGVAIGDNVAIGSESVIMPGVRIYPYKEVESGSQIFESLIWESRVSSRLFGRNGVSGLVNVDLTPEVAVRLGSALGTALKRGARVVTSREPPPACRIIKRAVITGITASGVDVADLRVIPSPVTRHLLKAEGYDAGLHIGTSGPDPEAVEIRFYEPPGIQIGPALQNEVEKHFTRQELRRAAFADVGSIRYPVRAAETYAADLLDSVEVEAIRERRFRIVIDYGYSAASFVLPLVLAPLGVEAVSAHEFAAERSERGLALREAIGQAKRLVTAVGADLGAVFDRAAERLYLIDERGTEVPVDQALLPRRPDGGRGLGRRGLRRRALRRLRLPGLPARLRRRGEPQQAARAAGARRRTAVGARRRAAALDARPPPDPVPVGAQGDGDAPSERAVRGRSGRHAGRDQGLRGERLDAGAARRGRAAAPPLRRGRLGRGLPVAGGGAARDRRVDPAGGGGAGAKLKLRLTPSGCAALLRPWNRSPISAPSPTPI
jgi:carbonic anhydrase/acetyltransferase-like protein (isoleucine patch superfamily)